jgi:hypothetical protein
MCKYKNLLKSEKYNFSKLKMRSLRACALGIFSVLYKSRLVKC